MVKIVGLFRQNLPTGDSGKYSQVDTALVLELAVCHRESAVDGRVCPGDEGGRVGGEEYDEPCYLAHLPDPTQRVNGAHPSVEL